MPFPFSSFALLGLVTTTFAQLLVPQDPLAAPSYQVQGVPDLEAPYAIPGYVALDSPDWPSTSTWAALNATLDGRLQALRPWAAVCYTDDPLFDPVACDTVLANYTHERTRESVASALLWTNWESCGYDRGCALNYSDPQPISGVPCYQGSTPPYSVAILSAQDASTVVQWATAHHVKLTIKNTGHDYIGRSSGPSSLQVLTHRLDDVVYIPDFVPQGTSEADPVPALKIGAGAQLDRVYAVVEAHNVSAVLGGCLTVGAAGGFIQAGGHSILSPAYGLAGEHVFEVEIVTADGVIRTINAVQDADLFWAVRGGGAGSWGIILSVTVGTLPPTAVHVVSLLIAPNPLQDQRANGVHFLSLLGTYQNQIVNSGVASATVVIGGMYSVSYICPTAMASLSPLYPLFDALRALERNYTILSNQTHYFSTLAAAVVGHVSPAADAVSFYGGATTLASRFVPQSMLTDPKSIERIAEAIWAGSEINKAGRGHGEGVFARQASVVMFGDMPGAKRDGGVNATGANPGFYGAAWEVIYPGAWRLGASASTYATVLQSVQSAVGPLTALGVTSSFQNEGSAWETDWQQAFFGYKYSELQAIKQRYDPDNFFTTWQGVASPIGSAVFSCYHQA